MPVLEAPDTPGSDQLVAPWVNGGQGDGPLSPIDPGPLTPTAPEPIPNADPNQPAVMTPISQPYASSAAGALFPPTVEAWRTTAQKYFKPEDVNKALHVIQGESGGNRGIPNSAGSGALGLFQIMPDNARAAGIDPTDPDQAFQWASQQVYNHGWTDWGEGTHYNGRNFGALGTPSAYGPGGTGVGSPADPGDGTNFGLPFSTPASGATSTALPADADHYGAIARAMSIINGRANPESSADPGLLASPAIYPLSPQQMQQQAQTQDDITKAHDTYQHLVDTQVMTPDQAQAAYDAVVKQLTTEKGPNVLQALFSLAASIAANRLPGGDKTPRVTNTGSGLDIFSDLSAELGLGGGQQSNGPLQQNVDIGGVGRIMAAYQQGREATRIPFVTPAIEDYIKPFVAKAIDMGLIPGFTAIEHLVAPHAPTVGKVASDQLPSTGLDFALMAAMDPEEAVAGSKALVGAGLKGGTEVVGRAAEAVGGDVAARVGASPAVDRVLSPDVLAAERKGANFAEAMGGSRYEGAQVGQSWNKKFDYLGLGEPNIAGGADVPENAPKFYRGTTSDAEPGLKPGTWVTDSRDAAERYADIAVSEAKAQGRDVTPVVSEVSVSPDQLQESHAVTGGKAYQVKAAEPTQEPIGTFPAAVKQVDKLTPNATSAGQSHGWLTPDGQTQQIVDPKIEHKDTLTGGSTGDKLGDALNEGWARIGMFGRSEHYVEADLSNPQVANRVRTYLAKNAKRGQRIILENANTGPQGFDGWGGTYEQWVDQGLPVRGGPLISKTAAPASVGDESLKSVIATAKGRSLKDMQTIATNRGVDIEGTKTKSDIVERMQAHVDGEPPYKPGGTTRPVLAQAADELSNSQPTNEAAGGSPPSPPVASGGSGSPPSEPGGPPSPLESAQNKLAAAAKEETNLRRVGTVARELHEAKSDQVGSILSAARELRGTDVGSAISEAAYRGGAGSMRQTHTTAIDFTPEERIAMADRLLDWAEEDPTHRAYALLEWHGSDGVLARLERDGVSLQPRQVQLIRDVFGEQAGESAEARNRKINEPSEAQLRAEADKAEARSVAQLEKAQRRDELALQDATHKAALSRDTKDLALAEKALDKANRAAIEADQARYDADRAEADIAWRDFNKAEDAIVAAQKRGELLMRRSMLHALFSVFKKFDDADQLEIALTRRYLAAVEERNERAALGRNVMETLGEKDRPLTAKTTTDYNWPRTRQAAAQNTYGKDWDRLSNTEKLEIARDHGAPEQVQQELQRVHQENLDKMAPNYSQLEQKMANFFTTYDETLGEFVPTFPEEERPAAELAMRIIKHQLDGNRRLFERMAPVGSLDRMAYLVKATLTGDLKDPYLTLLQRRTEALEGGLRAAGMDREYAHTVANLLRDTDITRRYGAASGVNIEGWTADTEHGPLNFDRAEMIPGHSTEVPESVTKALAEMRSAPFEDSWGGALDKFITRWKNTIYSTDGGVFGIHLKAAIDRGGISGIAGQVNRTLAFLSLPYADLYSAEVNLPRQIRNVLDGGHAGALGSPVESHAGTLLSYGFDRMGGVGAELDKGVGHAVDWLNDHAFGNIMGWIRDVNYEGNLTVLKLLGRDIEDPQVRMTAMSFAQATASFADAALNTTRKNIERRGFSAPSMLRGEVANLIQMTKFFRPGATAEERILAATLIGSRMLSTLVVGAALAAVIGVGAYEMNPTKPHFGQITTRWKDRHGRNIVISIFPQESLTKAFIQAVDVLAENQDPKTAANDMLRAFVGRGSIVGTTLAGAVGTGYDEEGHFHTGDLNKGQTGLQQVASVAKRAILPPAFSQLARDPDLAYVLLQGAGQSGFPESTSQLKNREAEAGYIYDASAEGGQRARNDGEKGEGVPYNKLLPSFKTSVDKMDTVTHSTSTFQPSDYKAAFTREKAKYDQIEQDDLQHWRDGNLAKSMPQNWGDISGWRKASGDAVQADFAKELGGIPISRVEKITQGYYDDKYTVKKPDTGALDFDATAAARQGYIDGLSTARKGNEPSDQEIMTDWLKKVEGDKTPEHAEYDRYIATKKALGYFGVNGVPITPQQKTALDRANPQIEADDWKWNGGVKPAPGGNDTTPTAVSAQAINIELGMQNDFPNRPIKLNGMEFPVNLNQGTQDAWKQYGQRAADFLQGYPNDAEFNARRAARQEGEATHLYQKPFAQLTDNEKRNVQSNLTSGIKSEVLRDSPDLEAYLAWSGVEKTIYPQAKPALDSLRQRFGLEPLFKNGEPIRFR